jgi:hypothetical protein
LLLPGLAAIPLIAAFSSGHPTGAVATPTPPFTECPAVGYNTSCSLLINVTASGTTVLQDTGATTSDDPVPGTYDGADDTLIGILNNSSTPLSQISLSSTTEDIMGFDGDGICENPNDTSGLPGLPASDCADVNTVDTTGYGGPNSYFTNISADDMSGTVNFITPIAPGASTYFSLEEPLTPSDISNITSVTTSLSGGGQSGASISVPVGTAVTDSATLTGTTAATATGTVTYNVYTDAGCTTLAPGGGGTAETITTPGTLPPSSPVALATKGTYYWQAVYSGDTSTGGTNGGSVSTCGADGEVETVTSVTQPQPTSLTTSLSGGGQSGTSISVPVGTAVTDSATLTGTNAATATGTVTYNVYTDAGCSTLAPGGGGTAETITTPGTLPPSSPVTLANPGTYYWEALYSGDTNNQMPPSTCGLETETVKSPATAAPTKLTTSLYGHGTFSGTRCEWLGRLITVLAGAQVTDSAYLSGTNAATAGGSVTYTVYKLSAPHHTPIQVASGGTVTVTNGVVPASTPVTINAPGTYYWQASYSGDALDAPSLSPIGSEIEQVIPVPQCKNHGWTNGNGQCSAQKSGGRP